MKEEFKYEIDAAGEPLGRAASKAALLLRGKNSAAFAANLAPQVEVKILNVEKLRMTGNKMRQKTYKRYSGYPGGLKIIKFEDVFSKNPREVFKKAVWGMLPKNKLRKEMIKNLIFA